MSDKRDPHETDWEWLRTKTGGWFIYEEAERIAIAVESGAHRCRAGQQAAEAAILTWIRVVAISRWTWLH